jgi:hypothetical protein
MPRSPRRRVPSCLRHLREMHGTTPVDAMTPSQRLDRSNDGQDHTVSPYASSPASPRGFTRVGRRPSMRSVTCSRGSSRPARNKPAFNAARVHRNSQPAFVTTYDRPFCGLGWPTHTIFPNFGKVEYFWREGLTDNLLFWLTGTHPFATALGPRWTDSVQLRSSRLGSSLTRDNSQVSHERSAAHQ